MRRVFRYWIGTIPVEEWSPPYLPDGVSFIKGQIEQGERTGYRHWQVVVYFGTACGIRKLREIWPKGHFESSRSGRAESYVWKDETAIAGTQIQLGSKPMQRNRKTDWDIVRQLAREGKLDDERMPADVYVRYYRSLRTIAGDCAAPIAGERSVRLFWGPTGSGKSRRAWEEAGASAYCKDPRSKFWCGYRGEEHIILDEFRGGIDVSHLLRWFDRYAVRVETKGGSVPLAAKKYWITSNIALREWYPLLDHATLCALERRIEVIEMI